MRSPACSRTIFVLQALGARSRDDVREVEAKAQAEKEHNRGFARENCKSRLSKSRPSSLLTNRLRGGPVPSFLILSAPSLNFLSFYFRIYSQKISLLQRTLEQRRAVAKANFLPQRHLRFVTLVKSNTIKIKKFIYVIWTYFWQSVIWGLICFEMTREI